MVEMYIGDKKSIAYPGGRRKNARMVGRGFHRLRKGLKKAHGIARALFRCGIRRNGVLTATGA